MAAPTEFKPTIVGFLCNWCCYGGADLAGVSRFQYPPHLRVIRLMCSGRVDLAFIFRAFAKKADAVFIGGCHLNDCHYNPEGNYDAMGNTLMAKRILEKLGVNPDRLRLEWVSAGEGVRFAEVMNELSAKVKRLGPLGSSEGVGNITLDAVEGGTQISYDYGFEINAVLCRLRFCLCPGHPQFFDFSINLGGGHCPKLRFTCFYLRLGLGCPGNRNGHNQEKNEATIK